jgi:3-hydroxyacyl-CoA dehydrogenase/enoyl-CoA hydratase/3-hydroxybutyryl-CoA epimerase
MSSPLPLTTDPATGIVTLTLEPNQGPMVILDRPLIQRIEASLRLVPGDAKGFILASGSPRVFVAGADLKSIVAMSVPELDEYLAYGQRVFGMIASLKCPTAAAINGAALGGGLELAMHCDALIAAKPAEGGKPYPVGLPEAGLSICPGWGGTNLLPARMAPSDAIRRTCTGKPMTLDEAITAGVFDAVAPTPADLLPFATAWVVAQQRVREPGEHDDLPRRWLGREPHRTRTLAALPGLRDELTQDPAQACLRAIDAGLQSGWAAALEVERRELNRLRNEPAGKAAIAAFFEKSAKK